MIDGYRPRENELSRLLCLGDLGRGAMTLEISANARERAALAQRFGLAAVTFLGARVMLKRYEASPMLRLRGRFVADVVQSCVITLDPVANHIERTLEVVYATDAAEAWGTLNMAPNSNVAPGEDDLPEILESDEIDVGEVVAKHLGLNLDPYPRCPGVVFSAACAVPGDPEGDESPHHRASPFAVLRGLKTI